MKTILAMLLISNIAYAKCTETSNSVKEDVVHQVNKGIPSHLVGATVTITLADGTTSTVPAEKFMVVPRKQYTVVGQNVKSTKTNTCSSDKKLTVMIEARQGITDIETDVNGNVSDTKSVKGVVPGIDVYKRELFDTAVGGGAGIDLNGDPKVFIGLDF